MAMDQWLGRLCIELGLISNEELQHALHVQNEEGGLLSDVFVRTGLMSAEDLSDVIQLRDATDHARRTGRERRRFLRLLIQDHGMDARLVTQIRPGPGTDWKKVTLLDISRGGIRIGYNGKSASLPVCELEFTCDVFPDGIRCYGRSCWFIDGKHPGSIEEGVEFRHFNDEDKLKLLHYILAGLRTIKTDRRDFENGLV